jgi:hypothetical protein
MLSLSLVSQKLKKDPKKFCLYCHRTRLFYIGFMDCSQLLSVLPRLAPPPYPSSSCFPSALIPPPLLKPGSGLFY